MLPTLSAALIVRNEEAFLGDCLESLTSVADEVVVVDTGSTDGTREIARRAGARVFDFPWCDDFSAARNFGLEQCCTDWILYIDADERVRRPDSAEWADALRDPELIASRVRFHPITGFTAYLEHRLFRNDPRVRFEGAMHETIVPSLQRLVAGEGRRIGTSDLTLDHLGYDGDQSHKLSRNRALLEKQIAADPGRVYLRWHLGCVYNDLGLTEQARESWSIAAELALRQGRGHNDSVLPFVELAKLAARTGEPCLELLKTAEALDPGNCLVSRLMAEEYARLGDRRAAIEQLRPLVAIDPDRLISSVAYDRRTFGAEALSSMGGLAFQAGWYAESAAYFAQALGMEPSRREFGVKAMLSAKKAGQLETGGPGFLEPARAAV